MAQNTRHRKVRVQTNSHALGALAAPVHAQTAWQCHKATEQDQETIEGWAIGDTQETIWSSSTY